MEWFVILFYVKIDSMQYNNIILTLSYKLKLNMLYKLPFSYL